MILRSRHVDFSQIHARRQAINRLLVNLNPTRQGQGGDARQSFEGFALNTVYVIRDDKLALWGGPHARENDFIVPHKRAQLPAIAIELRFSRDSTLLKPEHAIGEILRQPVHNIRPAAPLIAIMVTIDGIGRIDDLRHVCADIKHIPQPFGGGAFKRKGRQRIRIGLKIIRTKVNIPSRIGES